MNVQFITNMQCNTRNTMQRATCCSVAKSLKVQHHATPPYGGVAVLHRIGVLQVKNYVFSAGKEGWKMSAQQIARSRG